MATPFNIAAPNLPLPPGTYNQQVEQQASTVLRLFFNQTCNAVNYVLAATKGITSTSEGNVVIGPPTSGTSLTVYSLGNLPAQFIGADSPSGSALSVIGVRVGVGTTKLLLLSDPANTNGCNLQLVHAGATPRKTIRAYYGALEILNNAYSIALFRLTDAGNTTLNAATSGETLTIGPSVATGSLIATNAALTNNAGAFLGTLGNAPIAGNPTKWIKINDNGTIRSIPAW